MKKLLFAMAIGAALAWFLDPDAGSRRRDALRRKLDGIGVTGSGSSSAPSTPTSSGRPTGSFDDRNHDMTTAGGVVPPSVASIP